MTPPNATPQAGGDAPVTVVIVSGVGDDTRGSGRDAVATALASDPERRWEPATPHDDITLVAAADTGDDTGGGGLRTGIGAPNLREPFPVPTATVTGRDGAPDVRVYEMFWADLSRAQGPAQRLFYLLFAITLQIGTVALEAVRGFPEEHDPGGTSTRRWLARTLTAMSYWQAHVITPLILAMLTLAVTVNLELLSHAGDITGWALFGVIGLAGTVGASWVGERIHRGGWTFDATGSPWAYTRRAANRWRFRATVALAVIGLGGSIWFGVGGQRHFAAQLAYLALLAAVATIAATGAAGLPEDAIPTSRRDARRQVRLIVRTAVAAVTLGGMILAIFVDARDDGPAVKAADALTAVALGAFRGAWLVMLVLAAACAVLVLRVRFRTTPPQAENQRLSATVILAVMLGPVAYALATAAAFLVFAALWRVYPDSAKTWHGAPPRCPGQTLVTPIDGNPTHCDVTSTIDWGYGVVRATIQPLGLALAFAVIVVALLGLFLRKYVATFRQRNRYASAVDVALEQGEAFTRGLRRAGADRMFRWAYIPMIVAIALAAVAFWTIPNRTLGDAGEFLAKLATPVAYTIAVLAVAGIGLKNVGAAGRFGGGFLTGLARVLDFTYDVTSYLRVGNPAIVAPRVRMVARYRALMSRIAAEGSSHVVIMAHSQGTILTLATLLGDPDRSPPLAPLPAAARPAAPITFLSYGTPVTQTYAARFPGQFAPWTERTAGGSPIGRWINVFRAGDFIGRGVSPGASYDPNIQTANPGGLERCLGPGQHTLYVADERWRRIARHVVATRPPAEPLHVPLADLTVTSRDEPTGG